MTQPTKRIKIAIMGQSNARGKMYTGTTGATVGLEQTTTYGSPMRDPISPKGGSASPTTGNYGTQWIGVAQQFADVRNIWCDVVNTAVGGTTAVVNWVGRSGSTGTDPVYDVSDVGLYDPNSYIADMIAALQTGNNYDEKWVLFMHGFGDSDSSNDVSQANYANAHINVINQMLGLGFRCAMGLTGLRYTTVPAQKQTWFQTTARAAIDDVMANFSGNPDVIRGVNLDVEWGGIIPLPTDNTDDAHWGAQAYLDAGDLIFANLSPAVA